MVLHLDIGPWLPLHGISSGIQLLRQRWNRPTKHHLLHGDHLTSVPWPIEIRPWSLLVPTPRSLLQPRRGSMVDRLDDILLLPILPAGDGCRDELFVACFGCDVLVRRGVLGLAWEEALSATPYDCTLFGHPVIDYVPRQQMADRDHQSPIGAQGISILDQFKRSGMSSVAYESLICIYIVSCSAFYKHH